MQFVLLFEFFSSFFAPIICKSKSRIRSLLTTIYQGVLNSKLKHFLEMNISVSKKEKENKQHVLGLGEDKLGSAIQVNPDRVLFSYENGKHL